MGGPIMNIIAGQYRLSLWIFDTKQYQVVVMGYENNELIYINTLYCDHVDDLVITATDWLKEKNITEWSLSL
jgi:hypothetical protein